MTNAQSKDIETKTIVIDLKQYITSDTIIKDIATDVAKEIAKDIITQEEDTNCDDLALWLDEQEEYYHPDISKSKGMLRNPEIHKLFKEFVNDPKYSKHFKKWG